MIFLLLLSCTNLNADQRGVRDTINSIIHKADINKLNEHIQNFNNSKAEHIIHKSVKLGGHDKNGFTPLMAAAMVNNVYILKLLLNKKFELDQKIDIDQKNNNGDSALMLAAKAGFWESTNEVLNSDADIESRDNNNRTVLFNVVLEQKEGILQLLLNRGANINTQDRSGKTPLMVAYSLDNKEMINLILGFKPNLNIEDNNGHNSNYYGNHPHN